MPKGKFIALEGLDGSGISTQVGLLKKWFLGRGERVFATKEPTDGPIGALIRQALTRRVVRPDGSPLDDTTLALLFAADRVDHLRCHIVPKLEQGVHVISDRYYLSSFAYQSLGDDLEWIKTINSRAQRPDLFILLVVPPITSQERMSRDRWQVDLYEELPKMEVILRNYLAVARRLKEEGENVRIIDGARSLEEVQGEIRTLVEGVLKVFD